MSTTLAVWPHGNTVWSNKLMKKNTLVLIIYGLGILFLLNSAITDLINKAYWALFMDLEFIGFAGYMVFLYPKRKLKLNQDLLILLMIHFFVYALVNVLAQNWLMAALGAAISIGVMQVVLYRKKHKYAVYLK